jgi:hypothetical protein
VWACHVVVQNWVQIGMPSGHVRMNSFDRWASVMSGIFENMLQNSH